MDGSARNIGIEHFAAEARQAKRTTMRLKRLQAVEAARSRLLYSETGSLRACVLA